MWSLKMKNSTSGFFSASQRCTGLYPSKIGAQMGSFCLLVSSANPMVGVWEEAIPPTIVAIDKTPGTATENLSLRRRARQIAQRLAVGKRHGCTEPTLAAVLEQVNRHVDLVTGLQGMAGPAVSGQ